jgi:DnaJ family protein B protein 12
MFFNGGMGGMGGGFGPGFRVHSFGGNPYAQRRQHYTRQQQRPGASSAGVDDSATLVRNILHLLPILLPIMLYFLSPKEELYSFVRTTELKDVLRTSRMNIPFYANQRAFDEKFSDATARRRIESQIESERVNMYQQNCQYERSRWTMTTRPNCDRLRELQAQHPSVFRSQYSPW